MFPPAGASTTCAKKEDCGEGEECKRVGMKKKCVPTKPKRTLMFKSIRKSRKVSRRDYSAIDKVNGVLEKELDLLGQ